MKCPNPKCNSELDEPYEIQIGINRVVSRSECSTCFSKIDITVKKYEN